MKKIIAVLLVTVGLTGCSIVNSHITPQYSQAVGHVKICAPAPIKVGTIHNHCPCNFQGVKKSEYGLVTAKIYTTVKPTQIFRQALMRELAAANFCMQRKHGTQRILVEAELQQYFVEPETRLFYVSIYAVVQARVQVTLTNGRVFRRKFKGLGVIMTPIWYTSLPVWSDVLYTIALEDALQNFMRKAMPAIIGLISQHNNTP